MGLLDKVKNLFTEEVEEPIEEPIKKEVMQVEIPSPAVKKEEKVEALEEPAAVTKEEYQFPFFDDEDFTEKKEEPKKEEKPKREDRKKEKKLYQNSNYGKEKEPYAPKEEKKVFKPTPIISPVYGILDKNYQKEDIRAKRPRSYYDPKEATVDEIRNKAYGTLEDDIETTLFGKDVEQETEENKPRHGSDDELTDLLEAELSKDDPKEEIKEDLPEETEQTPRKISDSELFSMIDSMYQKGDEEK